MRERTVQSANISNDQTKLQHLYCILPLVLSVCQNTYTNAEKLLEAADQLAQSGECEEEEIYQAARDLELRMQVTDTEKK